VNNGRKSWRCLYTPDSLRLFRLTIGQGNSRGGLEPIGTDLSAVVNKQFSAPAATNIPIPASTNAAPAKCERVRSSPNAAPAARVLRIVTVEGAIAAPSARGAKA
jgi:hypothetical protein